MQFDGRLIRNIVKLSQTRIRWIRGGRGKVQQSESEDRLERQSQPASNSGPRPSPLKDMPGTPKGSVNVSQMLGDSVTYLDTFTSINEDAWSSGPYPKNVMHRREQAKYSFRPKIDPRETSVILFPGQGAQFVGMGKELLKYPNVQRMYETASDCFGYDLLKLCLEGPIETLSRTVYQQPAIFITSLAALERLKEEQPKAIENCIATAGYSVGEYAALVFAGALSFEDGCRLVKIRAEGMQRASEMTPSGMMTVFSPADGQLGLACQAALEYLKTKREHPNPVCQVAAYLFTQCKVVGGHLEALKFLADNCGEFKIQCRKMLPVSGAFHTPLMLPALEEFEPVLESVKMVEPLIYVHSNVDAKPYNGDIKDMKKRLRKQLVRAVRWEQVQHTIYDRDHEQGFPFTYEVGPGSQLGTLLKRTNLKAGQNYRCINV